jgi:hypothetical protein
MKCALIDIMPVIATSDFRQFCALTLRGRRPVGRSARYLRQEQSSGSVNVSSVVDAHHHDFPLDLADAIQDTEGAAPS